MKYANQLSDDELRELFFLFMGSDEKFMSLTSERYEDSIELEGYVLIPDDEIPGETIEVNDSYSLTDYSVSVYTHSGSVTMDYRKYMYAKFGNKYAKDYLFSN